QRAACCFQCCLHVFHDLAHLLGKLRCHLALQIEWRSAGNIDHAVGHDGLRQRGLCFGGVISNDDFAIGHVIFLFYVMEMVVSNYSTLMPACSTMSAFKARSLSMRSPSCPGSPGMMSKPISAS